MAAPLPFRLSAILEGHKADVKAICEAGPGRLATASRDGTVRLWEGTPAGEGRLDWRELAVFAGHNRYVNAVAYLPPTDPFPEGLIFSGGQDQYILAHTPSEPNVPALTLIGHTNNVCALAVGVHPATGRPVLVSGSWDMTARVWDLATAQSVQTLQGHTMAVWAVAFLENGDIATASADKTVRIWRDGHTVRTLTAHTDCIRALAVVPGLGVLSAANDATLILWSGDGECLQTFHGHTAYVYAVALLPDGDVVSTGEDRSLRVWHNGECVQTILHPADSIWSVATLANGDVATAANDGVVRVFSRDPARFAPEAVAQAFDAAVSAHAIPAEAMDLDPSTVAGPEALGQPGKKAGEVKMVRNGGVIEAYQWNGETFQWDKVGVVTEVRQQSKKLYNGAEYDFVFDVDLEDGGPPRKLPYNLDENPYMAAQNFIHREEISQSALDTIARFIIDNTKHARRAPAAPQPTANAAPFHSTVAEVPGAYMSAEARGAVAAAAPAPHTPPTSNLPHSPTSLLPKQGYVAMDAGNVPAIVKKLGELNAQQEGAAQLSAEELQSVQLAAETVANTSRYHATSLFPNQITALLRAARWPSAHRFPALDLLRLAVLHPSLPDAFASEPHKLVDAIVEAGQLRSDQDGAPNVVINRMMGARALANLCCTNAGRRVLSATLSKVVQALNSLPGDAGTEPYHVAVATVYLNLAVLLASAPAGVADLVPTVLQAAVKHLHGAALTDGPAFRLLVAVGTMAATDKAWRQQAIQAGVLAASRQWGAKSSDQHIRQVTVELAALLEE